MSFSPKRSDLERFFDARAQVAWVAAFVRLAPQLCKHYAFKRLRWVHFIGQIGHESSGLSLKNMCENMTFTTTARIKEVYSFRLRKALKEDVGIRRQYKTVDKLAAGLVRQPVLLADIVYGGREGTPWMQGSRFIGRGPTQITHLNNYQMIYLEILKQPGGDKCPNLVSNPEALCEPEWGVRSAFADWAIKGLNRYADIDNVDLVSDALNTGNVHDNVKPHGLPDRKRWVSKAKVIWEHEEPVQIEMPVSEAPIASAGAIAAGAKLAVVPKGLRQGDSGDEVKLLQVKLRELGYPIGDVDGEFGLLTLRAVRNFQAEHGLGIDGVAGPKTLSAMANSAPADLGARETISASELQARGSATVRVTSLWKRVLATLGVGNAAAAVDQGFNLGVVDSVVSQAEQTRSLVTRSVDLFNWLPSAWIVACLVIAVVTFILWRAFDLIEKRRVKDAQSGNNLAR